MSNPSFTDQQLVAYIDEMLPVDEMAAVERALRGSESLRHRAAGLSRRRDDGAHSVGEIWRRLRLSCPSRSRLGSYLLGTVEQELASYIEFHIGTVGCRICAANLRDLEEAQTKNADAPNRRRKFFQSSAGYLKKSSE